MGVETRKARKNKGLRKARKALNNRDPQWFVHFAIHMEAEKQAHLEAEKQARLEVDDNTEVFTYDLKKGDRVQVTWICGTYTGTVSEVGETKITVAYDDGAVIEEDVNTVGPIKL